MQRNLTLIIIILFLLNGTSMAQSDEQRRFIDAAKLPSEAVVITDFVPKGWMIEKQVNGSIDLDSKPDAVLQLVDAGVGPDEERYRALLVVIQTDDGKWRRIAAASRLLAEFNSGGMKCGSEGENIEVKLSKKGVLSVDQCLGGANLITYTHRFRYEANSKRMALIGADSVNGSPASQITTTSINYLTGVKIITRIDDKHLKGITRKVRITTAKKLYIEQLDNEDFQENGL